MAQHGLRKITVMLPEDLISRAVKASGNKLTPTIRKGLEVIAAADAYDKVLQMRGQVKFPRNFLRDLRRD